MDARISRAAPHSSHAPPHRHAAPEEEEIMSLTTFEKQDVQQFARDFESLFYAGDAVAMASFYADDAKLMAEDTEPIVGRSAIERFWQVACERARAANGRRNIIVQEVAASGNLGYGLGVVTVHIPQNDDRELQIAFKYATIWRREADGRWRLVVDISNRNAPLKQDLQFSSGRT
jgi:uncharacterized protein (TIGR02246 family)